jgi:hypothetical protein
MLGGKFYALALLSLVALAPSANAQRIEGFGKEVPLAFAVRQIVPNDYLVRFEAGIDQTAKVSWSGSDEWQNVLGGVTTPRGLSFRLDGQAVIVGKSDVRPSPQVIAAAPLASSPASPRQAATIAPPQTPARPVQIAPGSEEVRTGGLVIRATRPQMAAAPTAPTATSTSPSVASPPPEAPPSRSRSATPAPVAVEALPPAGRASGVAVSAPVGSDPSSWGATSGRAPSGQEAAKGAPISTAGAPSSPSNPSPVSTPPAATSPPATAAAPPQGAASSSRRANAATETPRGAPDGARSGAWRAPKGETLNNVLSDWADRSGWSVVFQSRVVYELQAGAQFEGDFVEAATALLKSVQATPMPRATFFRGNRVLLVTDTMN